MLDAASLKAIALEARHCFLLEDAPDFIELFHQSMGVLQGELQQPSGQDKGRLYQDLVRSAHSIKGGAGIAELTTLHNLAHQMEDLLEAIAAGRVVEEQAGLELIKLAMEEVQHCIDLAVRDDEHPGHSSGAEKMTLALQEFLQTIQAPATQMLTQGGTAPSKFVATALKVDLEACVQRLESLLNNRPTPRATALHLKTLEEECRLLGEALAVPWLKDMAVLIQNALATETIDPLNLGQGAIAEIRRLIQAYLIKPDQAQLSPEFQAFFAKPSQPSRPNLPAPEAAIAPPISPTQAPQPAPKQTSTLQVRMPIQQLNRMGNAVGELFIGYEKLMRHQEQLLQASRNLKKRTQQLNPIRDEVTALYDKLAVATPGSSRPSGQPVVAIQAAPASQTEFDTLHFDQYTQAHSQLQQFQELMVQVQEIQEDLELMRWEFQESLEGLRQQLEYLNQDLTQSRLMPFGNLARRFRQSLETLSSRYPQKAQLVIAGEQVLVDQAILEQLRTPLTHLIRNAFDHGLETPVERRQAQKPAVGTIRLSAQLRGNMVEILVQDDGRGIALDRVQQKAIAKGLCPPDHQPTEAEILEYLFAPGFSTRDSVSDLSGRGLGLDIVRLELAQLKGTITVSSRPQQGTQFTIRIPLSFNILPLLLCRCQQQAIAFPSVTVQAVVSLVNKDKPDYPEFLDWQGKSLKLHALDQLLPYPQGNLFIPAAQRPAPTIGLIVRQGENSLAIAVDEILGERELVLKSLEDTVAYPSYVAGCTVLGSGEVIPVLLPDAFDQLLISQTPSIPAPGTAEQPKRQPTILVIDDSVAVRRTLDKLLGQVGYQVQQCRDGKEAWNLLNRSKQTFDLAICDLEMPGYDGFTLLQMVRGQSQWDHLPFVMLTSRDNDLHRQKARDLGASDYFTKPFHPVRFLKAIAQYVEV
ncbi:hybrid sensor histidine kinase/response regulator [Synechococcus moorigangaii CMS01]|nr:hybrid sensor histidine kinase/response regulator [Synechococcus moorigangaii CMS01]